MAKELVETMDIANVWMVYLEKIVQVKLQFHEFPSKPCFRVYKNGLRERERIERKFKMKLKRALNILPRI